MNIAIIGAGFTGLSAAYRLSKSHKVTVFETSNKPGGLAVGYKKRHWDTSLEAHYHHWFTNDHSALTLADELGVAYDIVRPKTSIYARGSLHQFDSLRSVVSYPHLTPVGKLRTIATLGLLRINPFWQPLEGFSAHDMLQKTMGSSAYAHVWEPQLANKFDTYYKSISLAWFWARIKKRTPSLAYPQKGFQHMADILSDTIKKQKGILLYNTRVSSISSADRPVVTYKKGLTIKKQTFDAVLWTGPLSYFIKTAKKLPNSYKQQVHSLQSIGAINVVFRLKKPFFDDNTYWLSVCDKHAPLMALVEHTNFRDKKQYGNEHILYAGNYMDISDKRFTYSDKQYLSYIEPFLSKINPQYKQSIIGIDIFRAPVAQPIVPINYSHMLPAIKTPLSNVFAATMQHIYPWDRGTNYAIELGEQVANDIIS